MDRIAWRARRPIAILLATGLALALGSGHGTAETTDGPDAGAGAGAEAPIAERRFTETEWRALVEGKTLYYETSRGYPDGFGLMGKEYYVPNSNKVVFVYANGDCYEGTWDVEDDVFCFNYDARHCFKQFDRDGQWVVQEMDGREQVVVKITNEVLSCAPGLTS